MKETRTQNCHCCGGTGRELDHVAVGARLRQLREARGLTLRDVAGAMKFTEGYISELERGKRNWSKDLVRRFEEATAA